MLVYARLVREGIAPHDGLVIRNGQASDFREQRARWHDFLRVDAAIVRVYLLTRAHGHHHLFQRSVARALTNAAYRTLHLPCPAFNRGQGIRHGQAEVVVVVRRKHHLVRALGLGDDMLEHGAYFARRGESHRVGEVDYVRPSGYRHLGHLCKEIQIGTRGVFRAKLDTPHQALRQAHSLIHCRKHLLARHAKLVFHVDVRRGKEGMEHRVAGRLQSGGGTLDVQRQGASQSGYPAFLDRLRNLAHRLKFLFRSNRETCLDDIDTQPL